MHTDLAEHDVGHVVTDGALLRGREELDVTGRTRDLDDRRSSMFTGVTPCWRIVNPTVTVSPGAGAGTSSNVLTAQPPADAVDPTANGMAMIAEDTSSLRSRFMPVLPRPIPDRFPGHRQTVCFRRSHGPFRSRQFRVGMLVG